MKEKIAALPILLSVVIYYSCNGNTNLSGDVYDLVAEEEDFHETEISSTCGNGLIEENEECDGQTRACNLLGCGGGIQVCTPECLWGPCEEDGMTLLKEPFVVSDDMVVYGITNSMVWTGNEFRIFVVAKENVFDALYGAYHVSMDDSGFRTSPPFLFTPEGMLEDESDYVKGLSAENIPGGTGQYVVFRTRYGKLFFNRVDAAGLTEMTPGALLWEDSADWHILGVTEESILVKQESGPTSDDGVLFVDPQGDVLAIYFPEFCEDHCVHEAVADDEGYKIYIREFHQPPSRDITIVMQPFSGFGLPLEDPTYMFIEERIDPDCLFATYTGTSYGLFFAHLPEEIPSYLATLYYKNIDAYGSDIGSPVTIGTICGDLLPDAWDMAVSWTGSEYGLVYIEPVIPFDDPAQVLTVVKFIRLTESGEKIGDSLVISEGFQSHSPAIAWSGARFGVSWNEPRHPTIEGHLHFAVVGCEL
jgi:hypothetical protein